MKAYGPPGRAAEIDARIAKVHRWLLAAAPVMSEERNMQLLGLYWAGTEAAALKSLAATVLKAQRSDGAWGQHDGVAADADATGQSLDVLAKAGVAAADPAYIRGVNDLVATQNPNGSWRVASRTPKFQAYFNRGFPYAGDQWISLFSSPRRARPGSARRARGRAPRSARATCRR